jgi:porphobilinogen synthase
MDFTRHRRLRINPLIRDMLCETTVSPSQLIQPLFIHEGLERITEIGSMPGQYQYPVEGMLPFIEKCLSVGIRNFILFGIPSSKDPEGSGAYDERGVIQRAIGFIKKRIDGVLLIADTCLCEYTSGGQCGIYEHGHLRNDATLKLIQKTALSQAAAGADIIAPSVMIDGMVWAIRDILDRNGHENLPIMSYAAKFASAFYGPFRDAAGVGDVFTGDRKNHQMAVTNSREALREVASDVKEGADVVMVKPALPFLDIITRVRSTFNIPVCAYNVSGEYAMITAASAADLLDRASVIHETLVSIRRAGADMIITYFAQEYAQNQLGKT